MSSCDPVIEIDQVGWKQLQNRLWVWTAALVLLAVACGSGSAPTPAPGSNPVHVLRIWEDYQRNEPRANEVWKKKWLYLEMPVDVVENQGAVYYLTGYTGALGEKAIEPVSEGHYCQSDLTRGSDQAKGVKRQLASFHETFDGTSFGTLRWRVEDGRRHSTPSKVCAS